MKQLKILINSFADAVTLAPQPRGYRIDPTGPRADAIALQHDFAQVGNDLRRALKNDQQTYQRARKG